MKNLSWLYILLILAGCTDMSVEDISINSNEKFYATIEQTDSRTYVDSQIRLRWTAEDCITLFRKTTYNREYMFTGTTGANAGGFRQKSVDDDFWYGADVPYNYAIYPHSSTTQLDETDYFFTFTMPDEQIYAENSFGLGANTMVAVSESGQLTFKNVGSYLRVRLYGENVSVSSITLTSKGNEAIAGTAKITPSKNGNPTCEMTGTGKSIRLTCPEPVTVSTDANNPTDFWIVVPPVTLANGFSVTVENSTGDTQVYDVNKSFTFERNMYTDMKREVSYKVPNNQIWYTTTTNSVVSPRNDSFGDATIISNEIIDGKGIITFDKEIQTIGAYAFSGEKLKSIKIPNSVLSIGALAFYSSTIENITMPHSVTTIGKYAFQFCKNLTSISLPENITSIADGLFCGCDKLRSIIFPNNNVTSIGEYAFYGCASLYSIFLPSNVTSVGERAFYNCTLLYSVYLPDNLKSVGVFAFGYCSNLHSVEIPGNLSKIESSTFYGCSNLNIVKISNGTTFIGDHAFRECTKLKTIEIPNSVTSIGIATFMDCSSIKSLTLPKNLSSIGNDAFTGCNITTLYCKITEAPVCGSNFNEYMLNNCKLYVPKGYINSYKNSYAWKDFISIYEQ